MYKDPAEQLVDAQAGIETCQGCVYAEHWRGADRCQNPKVKSLLAERRCDVFREAK